MDALIVAIILLTEEQKNYSMDLLIRFLNWITEVLNSWIMAADLGSILIGLGTVLIGWQAFVFVMKESKKAFEQSLPLSLVKEVYIDEKSFNELLHTIKIEIFVVNNGGDKEGLAELERQLVRPAFTSSAIELFHYANGKRANAKPQRMYLSAKMLARARSLLLSLSDHNYKTEVFERRQEEFSKYIEIHDQYLINDMTLLHALEDHKNSSYFPNAKDYRVKQEFDLHKKAEAKVNSKVNKVLGINFEE